MTVYLTHFAQTNSTSKTRKIKKCIHLRMRTTSSDHVGNIGLNFCSGELNVHFQGCYKFVLTSAVQGNQRLGKSWTLCSRRISPSEGSWDCNESLGQTRPLHLVLLQPIRHVIPLPADATQKSMSQDRFRLCAQSCSYTPLPQTQG